mgnify:CR=1 FL=1
MKAFELGRILLAEDHAVSALSKAVRRGRVGLRDPKRPIGSFLFLGPTGVGKTEVARQLSKVMGIELVRFDMSEFSDPSALGRLTGDTSHTGDGLLTATTATAGRSG